MNNNSDLALKRIQRAIQRGSNKIDLSQLNLTHFPLEVLELTQLINLNLRNNQLTSIPPEIEKLENIKELDLSNNQLQTVPDNLGKLSNLRWLYLHNNNLTSLPEAIGQLTNLLVLYLSNNLLIRLPESFGNLTNLSFLYCSNNLLSSLPDSIGSLTKMKELLLNDNQLTILPSSFENLNNLRFLNLHSNDLIEIPENIGNLYVLFDLDLSSNNLKTVPKSIEHLTQLEILNLSSNKLNEIPETIGSLIKLSALNISSNELTSIPETIGNLANLSRLDVSSNELSSIPDTIEKLSQLRIINLNNNNFEIGPEVHDLTTTEQLNVILNWQKAQKAGTLQPIHEAKVIFIGESDYGKTHLIEFLLNGEIKRKITTTHGIERNVIIVPTASKDIRLNIWDLGGQEFMRSTHQFFFTERSLYVLVTLARRERNELNHWLKLANQLGNKAPVLVVINKIDVDSHDLDRKSLIRDYPNIIGFVRTTINDFDDSKAADTLELLKKKIIKVVSDKNLMPGVFEQRSPEWFTVKEELEKLEEKGIDFITYKEYENLKFIKDLSDVDRKSNLKLLNMIGAVVSYVDDPRLIDTNVINPQWIMDGVYAIINDYSVKDENKGRLHISDLDRILTKKKFPKSRHVYLLELMKKFNLCYAAKDCNDIFLIPDLFEDIEPDYEWDSQSAMHFRYFYDEFPPKVFIARFIVEMHQDILDERRWRSGVFISNGSCKAKVYQTFSKNYIHVEVSGKKGEDRSYLYAIREAFRKLHKPFPQMTVKQEVLYKDHWLDYLKLIKLEERNKPWYHVDLDEDLQVTDILNGYSTSIDREGTQRHLKIFLASSEELKVDREQFEIFIHRENQRLYKKGIFIELVLWENFIDAMSKTRLQDEYNNVIKNCDIFVCLFFTKVGKFTLEEFKTAFGQFTITGKPFIYTYFKDAPINTSEMNRNDSNSLFDFQEMLEEFGHFYTSFENSEGLQLHFKKQLEKLLDKF